MFRRISAPTLGASIPTVMAVIALMLMMAFTVLGVAFNHLNLSNRSSHSAQADHLAEAVLAQAIERLQTHPDFGTVGASVDPTIELSFPALPEGNLGVLTFDFDRAAALGIHRSLNNRSDLAVESSIAGKSVPAESVHLVARARVLNAESTMEAVVTLPKFPYSVASEGAIRSNGGLVVAAVRPGMPYDISGPVAEENLEPGHLVSNSGLGDDAVVLSGENRIVGDLRSSSGATIDGQTSVLGEIRLNSDKVSLPKIRAYDYDPEGKPGLQVVNSGAGTLDVSGFQKSYSNLTVDNGIRLNGGVLFVEGDLTVSAGGVSGKGAIITTGNLTVRGDGDASSDNQAALISDGNITLLGDTSDKAKFAGLVYSNGNLNSENFRLAGVFVAAGTNSQATFKDTELYQVPDKAVLDLESGPAPFVVPDVSPPSFQFNGKPIVASYDTDQLAANLESFRNPRTGPNDPEYLFKLPSPGSSTGYFTHEVQGSSTALVETTGPDPYVLDGSDLGLQMFGTTVTSKAQAETVAVDQLTAQFAAEGRVLTDPEKQQIRDMAASIFESGNAAFTLSRSSAQHTADTTSGSGSSGAGSFEWSLDLSEFYGAHRPMEIVFWVRQ